MSRYDHKIETSLEGIEHLSKEKKQEKERKMNPAKEKERLTTDGLTIFCKFLMVRPFTTS